MCYAYLAHMTFFSPTFGSLSLPEVAARVRSFVGESDWREHKLIIGSDSSLNSDGVAEFISAIVVHRVGNGGIYFWHRTKKANMHVLRNRMYHEALLSLELAQQLVEGDLLALGQVPLSRFEIHVDIGEHGPTRQMIREIVGMISGSGFTVHTKPASFAASKVADRHT